MSERGTSGGGFQSTLPRRERHFDQIPHFIVYRISIHAPAKGATCVVVVRLAAKKFQSTLPRRERPNASVICRISFSISIHAPAKGATKQRPRAPTKYAISIHAPAKGATFHIHLCNPLAYVFQSTLPRRERRDGCKNICMSERDFNPRSREGSDASDYFIPSTYKDISIHAPAKGATETP